MRFIILLLIVLLMPEAYASDRSIIVNLTAQHFSNKYDWNEENPGLGYRHTVDIWSYSDTEVTFGALRDSLDNTMPYAGMNFTRNITSDLRVGINVLALKRKETTDGDEGWLGVVPLPNIEYRIGETSSINITYIPNPRQKDDDTDAFLFSMVLDF